MDESIQIEKEKIELERMKLDFEREKMEFEKNDLVRNTLLMELLKENLEHGRHVESERLNFTSIYVAIVGGTLAYIGQNFDLKNMFYIFIFLLIFSFLGFLLSSKWGNVFDSHMQRVKSILLDLSSDSFDGPSYLELQKYDPKLSFIKKWKRTKNLFNGFYILMILVWSILLGISIFKNI